MLEYERIDISEEIDVNKTNLSKECNICHYWYFKDIGFKYEPYLCNRCHDLMQKAMGFNNIAIAYINGSAYRIHFWYISKDAAINIMTGCDLVVTCFYKFFLLYIKMSENINLTYYQKNRDTILNRAKDYYENHEERLREQAGDKYRNLPEEEKNKKSEYGKNKYLNMSEEKKKRLKEYQKNYREAKKSKYSNK